MSDLKKHTIAFSFFEGIGPLRFRALKKYFGSAEKIFKASRKELEETGLNKNLVSKFIKFKLNFPLDAFIDKCRRKNIKIISEEDEAYPKELREIKAAPFILYGIGDLSLLSDKLKFAVVGTRKPTSYGKEITKKLTSDLVNSGFTICSGMAMGIDAIAHKSALDLKGRTIAVLGCGVDICYPFVNKKIYDEICKKGLILSEFPPGQRTSIGVFPARNRIIAGLSMGVLVTEGAKKSGSLITANYASDFGREVFAVPGPITSQMSEATTFLLKRGANPVSKVSDILEEYKIEYKKERQKAVLNSLTGLTKLEQKIIEKIKQRGKMHIDEITRTVEIDSSKISSIISTLVIKGILQETEINEYTIMIMDKT